MMSLFSNKPDSPIETTTWYVSLSPPAKDQSAVGDFEVEGFTEAQEKVREIFLGENPPEIVYSWKVTKTEFPSTDPEKKGEVKVEYKRTQSTSHNSESLLPARRLHKRD